MNRSPSSPNSEGASKARQALQEILENAIEQRADAITLEYVHEGFEICFMRAHSGLGEILEDRELAGELVSMIVREAKLARKERGEMNVKLHGKTHTVLVRAYENFGEWAYELTLE